MFNIIAKGIADVSRDNEKSRAVANKNAANLDYIAMMAGIDIPVEDSEVKDTNE